LQGDDIYIDNDWLTASAAERLCVDLSLFLTNIEGIPWDSTAFGQKEQKDSTSHVNGMSHTNGHAHSHAHTNGHAHSHAYTNGHAHSNGNTHSAHSASAAWLHSSVQSNSAASAEAPHTQHPSIISTYCPQVPTPPLLTSLMVCLLRVRKVQALCARAATAPR
jgi:hypothetical protein